jgi:hypothetical protein
MPMQRQRPHDTIAAAQYEWVVASPGTKTHHTVERYVER